MEVEMQDTSNLTLNKIQQAAIDEFLEKGLNIKQLKTGKIYLTFYGNKKQT